VSWYLEVLKKYATFGGRARRKEYWMFLLVNLVITIVLGMVESQLGLVGALGFGMLSLVYSVVLLLPSIAVGVRRLHDTGRSGWWLLIAFVPLVGAIALIVFAAQEGEQGHNEYGPNPKGAMA
jgi:uncharacterized membrane protein YhaH (DUF805 family)